MSKITDLTFTGQDGKKFKFQVYPKNTTFRSIPALYAFMARRKTDGRYIVLYIGQTADLSTRFNNHHKWAEATRNGFEYIGVCTGVTLGSLDRDEKNLIAFYRPRCNEQLLP